MNSLYTSENNAAKPEIYCDHAATSFPKAPGVAEAVSDFLLHVGANVNRGSYRGANAAEETVFDTRSLLCRLFHFDDPSRAILTPGQTYSINQVLYGALSAGDHVIVSALEHNAVMRPLNALSKQGVQVSVLPAASDGAVNARDLLPLLRSNTKLVFVTHASNVCGTLLPVAEISRICWDQKIPLCLDAAQTAGHVEIDFAALHLSALCVPGHKGLLGPQGIGALLLEKRFAGSLRPFVLGGTGSASDSLEQPPYFPDRFESGTLNLPGIAGLEAALKFILHTGVSLLGDEETALTARFLTGLKNIDGVRVVGRSAAYGRVGVVSLDFPGQDNAEIADCLSSDLGISTRCGLHCAPQAHKALGTFPEGTVRFSFGYGNTLEEVDRVLDAIKSVIGGP